MWWIISAICVIIISVFWCCLKVASDYDDALEHQYRDKHKSNTED